jgi:hypothetical protein
MTMNPVGYWTVRHSCSRIGQPLDVIRVELHSMNAQ